MLERREGKIRESDFDFVEEARHQKRVPEFHLENLQVIERAEAAAAQREVAERGGLEIEFGKVAAHLAEGMRCREPRTFNISRAKLDSAVAFLKNQPMSAPGAFAIVQSKAPYFLCGAFGGYLLVMFTNPVRTGLRDGWRAIGRYQTLWVTLGVFGFCDALFQLAQRVYFHAVLPAGERPIFVWAREAWRDPQYWLTGSPESLWFLPHAAFLESLRDAALLALQSLAGIFNNIVTTFPLSALAAVLLLVNWEGHHAVLIRALRRRFGHFGWAVHLAIVVCALAAIAKPFIYVMPQLLHLRGAGAEMWFGWAPVVVWLSVLFEYLFGVCIQIYLILLAFIWVRGLTFTHRTLLDVAIRRFSYVVKWAALVMLLSTLCIDAPLILKNFPAFAAWFPENELFASRLNISRAALAVFLLLTATMQIMLTFHSESWRCAMRDHLRFVWKNAWPFAWFLALAALHLFALHACDLVVRRAIGEGTALWVGWTLAFPWLAGIVCAWLLASWVCVFKRCEHVSAQPAPGVLF